MQRIELRFLTGRFHATPPDHHVNEGLVEWPPSPWRILRALLATGFRKLGWPSDQVPPVAARLVGRLAGALPIYRLPPYPTLGHTRHYAPAGDRRILVLDAFVALAPEDRVEVSWPTDLDLDETELLRELLERLPYLGRSESWVQARLLPPEAAPGPGIEARPVELDEPVRRPDVQTVELLAPLDPAAYAQWRDAALDEARSADQPTDRPISRPTERAAAAAVRRVDQTYPRDLVSALLLDTDQVLRARWSAPPGSRRVGYELPRSALAHALPGRARPRAAARPPPAGQVYIRLSPHPPLAAALGVAERIHERIAHDPGADRVDVRARLLGLGARGEPLTGHRHLHLLPMRDGRRMVGLLGHVAAGWTAETRELLERHVQGTPAPAPAALLGPARVWHSSTPLVLVRHPRRDRDGPEAQLRLELNRRGLPPPVEVNSWSSREVRAAGFYAFTRSRRRSGRQATHPRPYGFSLRFDREVGGPIALGYGAHFGLGLFEAAPEDELEAAEFRTENR